MANFSDTPAYRTACDFLFHGLRDGGGCEHNNGFIDGDQCEREEFYALAAGNLAFQATDGSLPPAMLALVLSAKLGGCKQAAFERIKEFAVSDQDIQDLLYSDGKLINYRTLWLPDVANSLVRNFPTMGEAPRTAIFAYLITAINRFDDPAEPVPKNIQDSVLQVGQTLLSLPSAQNNPLNYELGLILYPQNGLGQLDTPTALALN
jgi:hypothetical protein